MGSIPRHLSLPAEEEEKRRRAELKEIQFPRDFFPPSSLPRCESWSPPPPFDFLLGLMASIGPSLRSCSLVWEGRKQAGSVRRRRGGSCDHLLQKRSCPTTAKRERKEGRWDIGRRGEKKDFSLLSLLSCHYAPLAGRKRRKRGVEEMGESIRRAEIKGRP